MVRLMQQPSSISQNELRNNEPVLRQQVDDEANLSCAAYPTAELFNQFNYSPILTNNQHAPDDELASFGPDGEDTDACELEPSISFVQDVDELLFSEFIDLQDVPMNVDESDWLKKFLPPCSMG